MNIDEITAGEHYAIFTDGSCFGNPGPGGWGALLHRKSECGQIEKTMERSGWSTNTTNNKMELEAAIRSLASLGANALPAIIYSDSQYVTRGMTEWVAGWSKSGWRKSDGKPVANVDLWQQLVEVAGRRPTTWVWVKGHAGFEGNERAHVLATDSMEKAVGFTCDIRN